MKSSKEAHRARLEGRRLNGQRNQCPGCAELFNSNRSFDKHRKPVEWYLGISRSIARGLSPFPRRYLSKSEMLEEGMLLNSQGFWIVEAMPEEVLEEITED